MKLNKKIKHLKKGIKHDLNETREYIKEPKHIQFLKILAVIIALGIVIFLTCNNLLISKEFNYFYDIGGEENYFSSEGRFSEGVIEDGINYVSLKHGLVYFNIPITKGSEDISVLTKIRNNFPEEQQKINLGAKDEKEWHYHYNQIYSFPLNNITYLGNMENIYRINQNLELLTLEKLKQTENVIIATDDKFESISNSPKDYENKETLINASLRGANTFYIYIEGGLNLEVKKQDINWYEGEDELIISLYDLDNNLIKNVIIGDDGIIDVNKGQAIIQTGKLNVFNLNGVYKLEFSNFDGIIREIKINTNKIVSNKLFLADNKIYNEIETKESQIYTELNKDSEIELFTYHDLWTQNVIYNNESFEFNKTKGKMYLTLSEGENVLSFPENDLIISGPTYFAFSKENYFKPFKQIVIPVPNDIEYLKNNVDYLITDYNHPIEERDWLITETSFNIKEDELYINEGKLSMVFNAPHLENDQYANYTIPIDWINITVYKPGMIERIKEGETFLEALKGVMS